MCSIKYRKLKYRPVLSSPILSIIYKYHVHFPATETNNLRCAIGLNIWLKNTGNR